MGDCRREAAWSRMTRRDSAPSVAGGRQTAVLLTPRFSSGSIEFSSLAPSRAGRRGGTLYPAQFTRSSAARLPRASPEERADSRFATAERSWRSHEPLIPRAAQTMRSVPAVGGSRSPLPQHPRHLREFRHGTATRRSGTDHRAALARRGHRGSVPLHESTCDLSPHQSSSDSIRSARSDHSIRSAGS